MKTRQFASLLVLVSALSACGSDFDRELYEAAVMEWRAERLASLKGESGYLNLAGLFWLEPGEYTFGAAPGNDLVFPGTETPVIGRFIVDADGVRMVPLPGVDVRYEGVPVRTLFLTDDTSANPVSVTHGSLAWSAIKREGRYAIRLRDYEHPAIRELAGLEYFPIELGLRRIGTLRRFDEPRVLEVDTVIEGLDYRPMSPGVVEFRIGGESFELEAYASGDRLFFVFGDETNSVETYPAGRFLYAPMPAADGRTVIDFNLAYSPPCAFNDFSTCPVASPRNRLPIRIEAGELFSRSAHGAPDTGGAD